MSIRVFLKQWRGRHKELPPPPAPTTGLKQQDEDLPAMTLPEFRQSGQFLRLRSRQLNDEFYLVAQESLRPELPDNKLVVYAAGEIRTLLMIDPTMTTLKTMHELKRRFNVEIEN